MTGHVALIGAGAMGGAIGARLVETGTPLKVFDLDTAKVDVLVAKGAVAAATELAEAAGVGVTRIPQALKGGWAGSAILQEYMPRFAARDYRRFGRIHHHITTAHDQVLTG